MGDNGYPLDLLSPVRHVATELDRVAPAALSVSDMVDSYQHPNTGDLARVRREQGLSGNTEAESWLIGQAIAELGKQVEPDGADGYRLMRDFEKIRYPGGKHLHRYHDPHVQLRDPFNPQSGQFSENIIRRIRKDPAELRESMQTFGWVEELPAITDERGVVLVGHRRLAIAKELGIAPVIKTVTLGAGDEGDAKRFRLALASNLGHEKLTEAERKPLAAYLYGEHKWSMQKVADALQVAPSTVYEDVKNIRPSKKEERRGRPRKTQILAVEAAATELIETGQPVPRVKLAEQHGIGEHATQLAIERARARVEERERLVAEPALPTMCTCPNCGNTHQGQ